MRMQAIVPYLMDPMEEEATELQACAIIYVADSQIFLSHVIKIAEITLLRDSITAHML